MPTLFMFSICVLKFCLFFQLFQVNWFSDRVFIDFKVKLHLKSSKKRATKLFKFIREFPEKNVSWLWKILFLQNIDKCYESFSTKQKFSNKIEMTWFQSDPNIFLIQNSTESDIEWWNRQEYNRLLFEVIQTKNWYFFR